MADQPTFRIRAAEPADVPAIAALMDAYLAETYRARWHGSAETLARDGFGEAFRMHVAEAADGALVGIVAWIASYDLHHCIRGGEVIDMYVTPSHRGRGVGPSFVFSACAAVRDAGGAYLRGAAVDDPSVRSLYERVAACWPGMECTVGGRAFRRLADLAGSPVRQALRSLPDAAWNHEP